MSAVNLTVEEKAIKEIDRKMRKLEGKTGMNITGKATNFAVTPVLKTARQLCPVGEGGLKASIKKKRKRYNSRGIAWQGVVTTAPHAHLVEYGHRLIASGTMPVEDDEGTRIARIPGRKGEYIKDVPPHPFMRPAIDRNKQTVVDRFTDKIGREIDKVK